MKRDYLFKVWPSSILASPVVMMLVTTFLGEDLDEGAFGFIGFAVAAGLMLSLPSFLIIFFLFDPMRKRFDHPFTLKLLLWLCGVACTLATFYVLYEGEGYDLDGNYTALNFSVTYCLCLTAFSFAYRTTATEKRS